MSENYKLTIMKELSIEEKAKRYDDLLVKLQEAKEDNEVCDERYCCVIDNIVPELKESEDERIKKVIKQVLSESTTEKDECYLDNGVTQQEVFAWLEKQGEQPKKHDVCDNCDQQGCCVSPCPMKLVEKHGEQNKVEPKFHEGERIVYECGEETAWLKSLKNKVQPKQEWSDVDKDILFRTIDNLKFLRDTISIDPKYAVNIIDIERGITWLKSLRPQTTWKPSGFYLECISDAIVMYETRGINAIGLKEILEELKKLKG